MKIDDLQGHIAETHREEAALTDHPASQARGVLIRLGRRQLEESIDDLAAGRPDRHADLRGRLDAACRKASPT